MIFGEKSQKKTIPDPVDGIQVTISEHLASEYDSLYNSLPYESTSMEQIKMELARVVEEDHEMYVEVTPYDVKEAIIQLKSGKSDGDAGLDSDHLINGTNYLNRLLSMLMNCSFKHAYMDECLKVSTIVSIPTDTRSSLIKSDIGPVISWLT